MQNLRSLRPLLPSVREKEVLRRWLLPQRFIRHQAFDAGFDQNELAEARKWHQSFRITNLPEGNTSFSRSSGPGGQHVNKCVRRNSCSHRNRHVDWTQDRDEGYNNVVRQPADGYSSKASPSRASVVQI